MCGISGFNWRDEQKIGEMVPCISYRGPDAEGVYVDDDISLGHNRLSIIDLSKEAHQPMFDNARELVLVFNGEIYNFKDIKKELEGEYDFRTKSDSEVILAGYRKWGKDVVKRLNGMFAFALWDKRDRSLLCARDHAGMKPFYYFWDPSAGSGQGGKFIFASELGAILTHDIERRLDTEALNYYMRALYVPSPKTLVRQIYKLPPASLAVLRNGALTVEQYADDPAEETSLPYDEAVKTLHDKVLTSVERHLISDVPVGIYLSGGIDSSVVLASVARLRTDIQTFSIGFDLKDGEEGEKFNHDFELARKTADFFNTRHHPVRISVDDALAAFDEMVKHNSDPISNPTSIAMMLLARFARQDVTVALTGNGGDELFGGYDRYRTALWARLFLNRTDLYARFMFEKDPKISRILSPSVFVNASTIQSFYAKYLSGPDAVTALMNADRRTWLPDHFFMLSDKMSMASALEERMPLIDKELASFADALPRSYKLDRKRTKKILKDAFANELPSFLLDQPKRGWFSPAAKWLRNPGFSTRARAILSPDYYDGIRDVFNWPELRTMLEKHIAKEEYNLTLIWAAITLLAWAKHNKITL